MHLLLVLAATLQASSVEVWTASDDGLTQRFADAFRAAAANKQAANGKVVNALVEPVYQIGHKQFKYTVTFSQEGRTLGVAKCAGEETDITRCAVKIVASSKKYFAKIH